VSPVRHSPVEVTLAAAETMARRLPVLWWAMLWPSPAAHAEVRHMAIEKPLAAAESLVAVQAQWLKLMLTPWWQWPQAGLADKAAAPVARRVKANARRLRGRRIGAK